jgi:unsaturated chondroitin disaccharide hydrolase
MVMSSELWDEASERMLARIRETAQAVGERFPHWANAESGEWTTTADGDWTGGYFPGMLWLAYRRTGDEEYRRLAHPFVERLRGRLGGPSGFRSFLFYYGGSLGAILAGDKAARRLALDGARDHLRLYDPTLRVVPIGSQAEEGSHLGPAEISIDMLQAAPFFLWVARETDDPELREAGQNHARRVIELHLREDSSFIQSSSLDPNSGELVRHYTHKGYSETSIWGRAQAWGTLFSVMSYLIGPPEEAWLRASMRGADWWIEHVPSDRVAHWDFDDPAIPRGAPAPPAEVRERYRRAGEATVEALVRGYLTPTSAGDRRSPGRLVESCFNKRTDARPQDAVTNAEFIVGSYYLFECLQILSEKVQPTEV